MSDKILPATDAEMAALKECLVRFDAGEVTLGGPQFASGCERLIARIEADRATIRAKDEEIERLRKVRTGSAVNRLHNLCDGFEEMDKRQEALISELVGVLGAVNDSVTAALAKAKEAGR